jgi:hypothetical protein
MAYYVFALVDQRPRGRAGAGLTGGLIARPIPGGFVIVERRADVPPVELGALKKHDSVVRRLADAVPAILPVRFGTLLEVESIEEALLDRDEEIGEAFDAVRNRQQFTWRRAARIGRSASALRAARPGKAQGRGAIAASGTAYLRAAVQAARPPAAAPAFRAAREKLRPFVAVERYQPATSTLPDSLYHLVDRGSAARYRALAETLASASPLIRVTGPFPPFAFTPELL